eukprot:TRINITY_DN414_c0_g1_i1.p1 TRINITY_DN414_c0_g1~~TRINITY_DN414_c0_g1_i1.p1  ORF type:complete len:634 (+),score=119.43 TRINITY_DN414_c0_g1_i1:6450-8351(+)
MLRARLRKMKGSRARVAGVTVGAAARRPVALAVFLILPLLFVLFRRSHRIPAAMYDVPSAAPTVVLTDGGTTVMPDLFSSVLVLAHHSNTTTTTVTVNNVLSVAQPANVSVAVYHFSRESVDALKSLPVSHLLHEAARPYEDALIPLRIRGALIVRAGVQLPSNALSHLRHMLTLHAHRPDVAVISLFSTPPRKKLQLSSPDHDEASWTNVTEQAPFLTPLLYGPALDAFLPLSSEITDTVPHFDEWLRLRRSDWYHYPTGAGVDHTPLGMSALAASKWTRAPWNVWFSQFLSEYHLFVLHAPPPPSATDILEQQRLNSSTLRAYDASGKPVPPARFEEAVRALGELARKQDGVLSFTLVNQIFLPTARSWLCNVDVAGIRPRGLVWAATDAKTQRALAAVEGSATVLLDDVKGGKDTGHEFGNPGYWRLMLERTQLIGEILANGISVFAFETDAIWLEDPQPWIDKLVRQKADIVGTINTRMEVSGNFFFLRATLATRRLWFEIVSEFEKAYKKARFERKNAGSWTYIENDQSLLTKLVLRNETWRRSYPLSFLTLDMEKFVDGRWYKMEEGFYTSERSRSPVVINNNFVIGVAEKTERAKKWGHWFWDEENEQCLEQVVKKAVRSEKLQSI